MSRVPASAWDWLATKPDRAAVDPAQGRDQLGSPPGPQLGDVAVVGQAGRHPAHVVRAGRPVGDDRSQTAPDGDRTSRACPSGGSSSVWAGQQAQQVRHVVHGLLGRCRLDGAQPAGPGVDGGPAELVDADPDPGELLDHGRTRHEGERVRGHDDQVGQPEQQGRTRQCGPGDHDDDRHRSRARRQGPGGPAPAVQRGHPPRHVGTAGRQSTSTNGIRSSAPPPRPPRHGVAVVERERPPPDVGGGADHHGRPTPELLDPGLDAAGDEAPDDRRGGSVQGHPPMVRIRGSSADRRMVHPGAAAASGPVGARSFAGVAVGLGPGRCRPARPWSRWRVAGPGRLPSCPVPTALGCRSAGLRPCGGRPVRTGARRRPTPAGPRGRGPRRSPGPGPGSPPPRPEGEHECELGHEAGYLLVGQRAQIPMASDGPGERRVEAGAWRGCR